MADIAFTITSKEPADIVSAIRSEMVLRSQRVKDQSPGARTQKESARFAGEISALDGVIWFLDHIQFD